MTKTFFLIALTLILAACGDRPIYDQLTGLRKCTWSKDESSFVKNSSDTPVTVRFCSTKSNYATNFHPVPVGSQVHRFNVRLSEKTENLSDDCRAKSSVAHYSGFDNYPSLSATDLGSHKICIDPEGIPYQGFSSTSIDRGGHLFLILDQGTACPTNFQDFDQSQNPC